MLFKQFYIQTDTITMSLAVYLIIPRNDCIASSDLIREPLFIESAAEVADLAAAQVADGAIVNVNADDVVVRVAVVRYQVGFQDVCFGI